MAIMTSEEREAQQKNRKSLKKKEQAQKRKGANFVPDSQYVSGQEQREARFRKALEAWESKP